MPALALSPATLPSAARRKLSALATERRRSRGPQGTARPLCARPPPQSAGGRQGRASAPDAMKAALEPPKQERMT